MILPRYNSHQATNPYLELNHFRLKILEAQAYYKSINFDSKKIQTCHQLYVNSFKEPFKIIGLQEYCTLDPLLTYNFGYSSNGNEKAFIEHYANRNLCWRTLNGISVKNRWQKIAAELKKPQATRRPSNVSTGSVLLTDGWSIAVNDCWILASIHAIACATQASKLAHHTNNLPYEIHVALPEDFFKNPSSFLWKSRTGRMTVTARELMGLCYFGFTPVITRFNENNNTIIFIQFKLEGAQNINKAANATLTEYASYIETRSSQQLVENFGDQLLSKFLKTRMTWV